ncbi:hypothetical protein BC941DRAFT_410187 [Chlamydoabsidia padenii]|nr:hypothetical protein BC941DRAFT_410187 [Chlamydoabsidia padenii]
MIGNLLLLFFGVVTGVLAVPFQVHLVKTKQKVYFHHNIISRFCYLSISRRFRSVYHTGGDGNINYLTTRH